MGYPSYDGPEIETYVSALLMVNVKTTAGRATRVLKLEVTGKEVSDVTDQIRAALDMVPNKPFVVAAGTDNA